MSRGASAVRSETNAPANGGIASRTLRALSISLRAQGTGASQIVAGKGRALTTTMSLVVALSLAVMLVLAVAAQASKFFDSTVGTNGNTVGLTFGNAPRDVAVNDPSVNDGNPAANGDFYIVDDANHRIQRINTDGTFDRMWGADVATPAGGNDLEVCTVAASCKVGVAVGGNGTVAGNGTLDNPQGIAVDQDTGNVYVSDRDNRRISVYTADGAFVRSFGFDVNATTAGVGYEVCATPDVCKIGVGASNGPAGQFSAAATTNGYRLDVSKPDGNPATGKVFLANTGSRRVETFNLDGTSPANFGSNVEFSSSQPLGVTVDSNGIVYAIVGSDGSFGSGHPLARYDTAGGVFLSSIDLVALTGNGLSRSGLEVDRTGRLFVTTGSASVGVFEIASPATTPTLVATHPTAAPAGTFVPTGVGVNPDTGKLFVPAATTSGAFQGRTVVFDDDGLSPIEIALLPATNVDATTAGLHATINAAPNGPTGQPTTYRFEVSKTGLAGDWTQVTPDIQVPPNGDTDADVAVQAEATGLEPNTFYRVRVVATRAGNSGAATSAELFVLTDPAPPSVETAPASRISDTEAQLNGTINPGGLETTYWFEWGDDAYGNQAPVPAASATGSVATGVAVTLTGLEPERHYHFRLCAQNSATGAPVCGADYLLLTRGTAGAPSGRAYEMVTSPDKVLRRGGDHGAGAVEQEYLRFNGGVPDLDGGALMVGLYAGVNDPGSGAGWSGDFNYEVRTREDRDGDGQADGWYGTSLQDVPPVWAVNGAINDQRALAGDFSVSAWDWKGQLFENGSVNSIHVLGDDGGPRGAGWYPWLDAAWYPGAIDLQTIWQARIAQHGERLVGWSGVTTMGQLRDLQAVGDALAPAELSPPQTSGAALFLADPSSDWAPRDLVNECSGTAGDDATLLPARVGSGIPSDTLGERECAAGSPTSVLGAMLGSSTAVPRLGGAGITSLSDDGNRIFFLSPDSQVSVAPVSCTTAVAAATSCPPQLFVRQYDDEGNATVRWLSRAEDALFDAPQAIGLLGNGVSFEGAARDGSAVYFRTNAPLTVDDPNGGAQLPGGHTTGTASPVSWDLYRYELGADNGADPASGDPGDRLTRVSGGPSLDADPNTNCTAASADCGGTANGGGSAVRFMSDDGSRVYFVTAGPIGNPGDSWNEAPAGSAPTNVPGGGNSSNASTRNLYLYDEDESGADAYRFVARIPFAASGTSLDQCSSSKPSGGDAARFNRVSLAPIPVADGSSCVHGTRQGDALVFETTARLTADDTDTAADVYLYDQQEHALVRVSAHPAGAAPYVCATDVNGVTVARCNGDLGFGLSSGAVGSGGGADIGTVGLRNLNIAEAADGTLDAVYFESMLPLLPADQNTDRMDVYEYRRSDGLLTLVSPGHPDHGSFYSGNSLDGEDVFFWTENRISPWEIDEGDGDVYDARRGGGLPDPPAIPPVCAVVADACQDGGAEPTQNRTETASRAGGGNAVSGRRQTLSVSGLSAAQLRKAARSGVLRLRVRTSSAGVVRLGARAKIGRKTVKVAGTRKRVRRAGVMKVNLRLNARARKVLRSGRALRVALQVAQSGARTRSATVTLKRSKRS